MSRPKGVPGPGRLLPPWAAGYQRAWLRDDTLAGATLAVMLIPQGMAYAALAGVPPITGLYAGAAALVAYAALGSSSHLSFGPVALVSLLTAAAIDPLAQGDVGRAVALAGTLALLVAAIHLVLGLLRAGALVNQISHPVLLGFAAACGRPDHRTDPGPRPTRRRLRAHRAVRRGAGHRDQGRARRTRPPWASGP